jgi:hypothetical protein
MSASTMDWRSFVGAFFTDLFDQLGARMTSRDLCDWGCISYSDNNNRRGDIVELRLLVPTTGRIEKQLLVALPSVLCNLSELCLGSHMLDDNGLDIASFFTAGGLPPQLQSLVVSRNRTHPPAHRLKSTCSVAIDGGTHSFRNLPRSLTHIDFRFANLDGRADFCGDDFPPRLAALWLEGNPQLTLTGSIIDCAPFVMQTLNDYDIRGVSVRLSPIHVTELAAFVDMSRRYRRGALSPEGVRAMVSSSVVGDDGTSSANSIRCFLACAWPALVLQNEEAARRKQIEDAFNDDPIVRNSQRSCPAV